MTQLSMNPNWVEIRFQLGNSKIGLIDRQGCLDKSISTGDQYITPDSKIYCEKVKMCRFSSGKWFFCTNLWRLPWLVKGSTQLCTSKKECNKLDLTAAQYFWLVDHNDWSRWFDISSSYVYAVRGTVLLVGLSKKKTAKRRHLTLLSRVTYWRPVEATVHQLPTAHHEGCMVSGHKTVFCWVPVPKLITVVSSVAFFLYLFTNNLLVGC
jgi:hypothetical protein